MPSIKSLKPKINPKNLREIVNITSFEDSVFPLKVNYEGILMKMSQKNIPYLMIFRKEGDILTIGNTPVVKFYSENFETLDKTEGVITLDKIKSKKSPTGYTIIPSAWNVVKKKSAPKIQITFSGD